MNPNSAYLLITCNDGKLDDVMTLIKRLDNIKEIQGTFGAYDIIARVESTTMEHLQTSIIHKIRTLTDVKNAMMLHCKTTLQ